MRTKYLPTLGCLVFCLLVGLAPQVILPRATKMRVQTQIPVAQSLDSERGETLRRVSLKSWVPPLTDGVSVEEFVGDRTLELPGEEATTETSLEQSITQILGEAVELDGFEDYSPPQVSQENVADGGERPVRTRLASFARRSNSAPRLSLIDLSKVSRVQRVASGPRLVEVASDGQNRMPRGTQGGGGGGVGNRQLAQVPQSNNVLPALAGLGGSSSSPAAVPVANQSGISLANAIANSPLLANNSSQGTNTATNSVSSGRPQLTSEGKFGIPNAQYWTFDFTDTDGNGTVNKLDADKQFRQYLYGPSETPFSEDGSTGVIGGLEEDLRNAKQVVKYSATDLEALYGELNDQVPNASSPSYLTFMIIEFPLKGFYLPANEIPDVPGLPSGAVD